MSIAEATVAPGEATSPHAHRSSEGIYNILEGLGTMWLDGRCNGVVEGDSIRIRQGARHHIVNDGDGPLRFLCCCSPPYSDEDTVMG